MSEMHKPDCDLDEDCTCGWVKHRERQHDEDAQQVLCFFSWQHLPPHLQEVSRLFAELAEKVATLPPHRERTKALDLLLAAKDAAVRTRVKR